MVIMGGGNFARLSVPLKQSNAWFNSIIYSDFSVIHSKTKLKPLN